MTTRSRNALNCTARLLLGGSALATIAALPVASIAAPTNRAIIVAQATTTETDKNKERQQRREPQKPQTPAQPTQPKPPTAAQPKPPGPATTQQQQQQQQRQEQRRAPTTTQQQQQQQAPATTQQQQQRQEHRAPTTTQQQQQQTPATTQQQQRTVPPSGQRQNTQSPQGGAPTTTQQQQNIQRVPSTTQQQQQQQRSPTTTQQQPTSTPSTTQQQQQTIQRGPAAVQTGNPAVVAPPVQTRDASEFLRRGNNQGPGRRLDQVKQERHEVREGNRTFIREGDRTIVRENNTVIIQHNEANRFAIGARNVVTERRGANSETIIERGNGIRIVTITDPEGRLIRRVRRDASGREIVIIDNSFAYRRGVVPLFVQLAPPVIRIPRERYILDAERAGPDDIYGVLMEPPVEMISEPYTLEQVRFSAPLRDRMPRIDLDINFDTGSWELTPDQVDRLQVIAGAIIRALERNPREVFMIEGHTDAVGNDVDNLSLSDRRAESVAVALTEQFQVPAENLVTQGYGEQYLKVPTQGPERLNRRVAVRRITPLIDQQATNAPPPR